MKRLAAATAVLLATATVGVVPFGATARADTSVPSLPSNCSQTVAGGTVTCTYGYTGGEQTFTLPIGVTSIGVDLIGAAGQALDTAGGRGAEVSGTLTGLTSGGTLYVEVGSTPASEKAGFNGGGKGSTLGGGGGGATDLRTSSSATALTTKDTRIAVAGGGGGGAKDGYHCDGPSGNGAAAGLGPPVNDGATCIGKTGGGGGGAGGASAGGAAGIGRYNGSPASYLAGNQGGLGAGGDSTGAGGGGGGLWGGGSGGGLIYGPPVANDQTQGTKGGGGGGSSMLGGQFIASPTLSSAAASATITYQPGTPEYLTLSPAGDTVVAGTAVKYSGEEFDSTGAGAAYVTGLPITDNGLPCPDAGCLAIPGTQTISSTFDGLTATTTLTGTLPVVQASKFLVTVSPASVVAGTPETVTVTAQDASATPNTALTYTGTVDFTSTDLGKLLPPSYTFTLQDGGTHTFTDGATLTTAGSQTITATDHNAPSITGTSNAITVTPGPFKSLAISPMNPTITAGQGQVFKTNGVDAYGNSTGDLTFSSDFAFGMVTDGFCESNMCIPASPGGHEIFASYRDKDGNDFNVHTDLTATPAPVKDFIVTTPATAIAGDTIPVTIAADPGPGNGGPEATGYTGSVQLKDTGGQFTQISGGGSYLPTTLSFSSGDQGSQTTYVGVVNAGRHTFTATDTMDSSLTGSSITDVTPGAPDHLTLTPTPASATVKSGSVSYTPMEYDAYGNQISDPNLAPTYSGDGVSCMGNVCTPLTPGDHTVTASYTPAGASTAITGTATLTGNPATTRFLVSVSPTSVTAGVQETVTVTAEDSSNNTTPAYTGTIDFSSTDKGAKTVLPPSYTFTAGDNGTHTFTNAATLTTAGSQTITATDDTTPGITGTGNAVTVTAGSIASLAISPLMPTVTAGQGQAFTSNGVDTYGNNTGDLTGSTSFAFEGASDPSRCKANTCVPATPGVHEVIASYFDPNLQEGFGADTRLTATPATVESFDLTAPGSATAGDAVNVTVAADPGSGNGGAQATGYVGTITLTSSDPGASILNADGSTTALSPSGYSYPFTAADDGSHTFQVVLTTAGNQTFTATDSSAAITGTSTNGTTVSPGAPYQLVVTPAMASVPVDSNVVFGSTEVDAYGNTITDPMFAPSYTGDEVTCSGATCTPLTLGDHTVTASYTPPEASAPVTGVATLTGTVGPTASLLVAGPASTTAGEPASITVTAQDAALDTAPYTGTVRLTSTDPGARLIADDGSVALLPVDYTFTSADAGSHVFPIEFTTAGSQTVTASDTTTPSLSGTTGAVAVGAGPAASLALSPGTASVTAGQPVTYTVTGSDAYGNSLGDVTAANTFAISPDGSCAGASCTPANAGSHTVTATDGDAHGTASVAATAPPAPVVPAPPVTPAPPVPPAPVVVPVVPGPIVNPCALSITRSAATIAYGKSVTLRGTMACAGLPVAGAPVLVRGTYTHDRAKTLGLVHTDASGHWSFATKPAYNTTITASGLGVTAATKVGVAETFDHVKVTASGGRVKITARLHPGFTVTRRSTLLVTVTATSTVGVLQQGQRLTKLVRLGGRTINHGYVPLTLTFGLPPGRYSVTLTVSGTPASTTATTPSRSVRVA